MIIILPIEDYNIFNMNLAALKTKKYVDIEKKGASKRGE